MAGGRPRPKTVVLVSFVFVMALLFSCAFLLERTVAAAGNEFNSNIPVQYREIRQESSNGKVFATVKGSIYESGSNMTVFGACQDAKGELIPGSTAKFTAWYPNGTLHTVNASMMPILDGMNASGRFRIHITMPSTIGTYFTEMRCEYRGEYGLAYGEWQNPEWVYKIGQTLAGVLGINQSLFYINQTVTNISNNLNAYQNTTQQNLSQMLSLLNGLNTSSGISADKLKEIYNLKYDLSQPKWVVDGKNLVYVMGSGSNNFAAVDVLDRDNVLAAGDDGEIAYWRDGQWTYSWVNASWMGASLLPSPAPYYWVAGMTGPKMGAIEVSFSGGGQQGIVVNFSGGNMSYAPVYVYFNGTGWSPVPGMRVPVYSIAGGPVQTVNEPWFVGASSFADVKIFNQPNKPGTSYYTLLLADNGQVLFSPDGGLTWKDFLAVHGVPYLGFGLGRISNVVANTNNATEGFRAAFVTRSGWFAYFDGINMTHINMTGNTLTDVSLLRDGVAYILGTNRADNATRVYKYENGNLTTVYSTTNWVIPASIAALASDDIWVATADPAVFYHFDGFKWEYMADPFTAGLGVFVSFGGFSSSTVYGVRDLSMHDGAGYAVGADGLIMKLWSVWDQRFDEVLNATIGLNAQIANGFNMTNQSINVGFNQTNQSIYELKQIVVQMNSTMVNEFMNINNQLSNMTVTQQQILTNVTYTNQYLTTVVGPALTDVLVYLGIIDAKLNQTIEMVNTTIQLQNQTLQIVNATDAKVDDLIAKSERPRAWTTQ